VNKCPMCGHGQPYVPTHVATLDELSEQVLRRNKSSMNANSEAVHALVDALKLARAQLEHYSSHSSLDGNDWGFWEPKRGWEQGGKQLYFYEGTRPWVEAKKGVTAIDEALATYGREGE